ncbi:DUF6456 domain-containing protein [Sandarakinorhabdus sp. AAP62]|uniref:DUF6456 domain-containing protein n=1 Tax=Sandarakinorhabdus sp. AAP62 TaxID=1248916 RepID=UPI00031C11D8|nr:DUF6456 domain-containing protein [Sandarakinorhabdus sp. AAP62]
MPRRASAASPDIAAPTENRLLATRILATPDIVDRARVTVNLAESPLAWLVRRGHVSPVQLLASERLRADFHHAQLGPRVTMRWDPLPAAARHNAGGPPDLSGGQIAAKRRFEAAVAACGPGLSDIAWRVICQGEGLEAAERALGWPVRAGKLVLQLALDRLVSHYGMQISE